MNNTEMRSLKMPMFTATQFGNSKEDGLEDKVLAAQTLLYLTHWGRQLWVYVGKGRLKDLL